MLKGLCVGLSVSASVFSTFSPLPEARELGSSAQSADTGERCVAGFEYRYLSWACVFESLVLSCATLEDGMTYGM